MIEKLEYPFFKPAELNCTSGETVSELGNLTNAWGKFGVLTAYIRSVSGQGQKELERQRDVKIKISYSN